MYEFASIFTCPLIIYLSLYLESIDLCLPVRCVSVYLSMAFGSFEDFRMDKYGTRVTKYGHGSKPWYPSEHQNRW